MNAPLWMQQSEELRELQQRAESANVIPQNELEHMLTDCVEIALGLYRKPLELANLVYKGVI